MVENIIRVFLVLAFVFLFIIFTGYVLFGINGLLIAFTVAIPWTVIIYFCRDYQMHRRFSSRRLKGLEHWDVKQMVAGIAKEARIPAPSLFVSPTKAPTAFSLAQFGLNPCLVFSEGLLELLNPDELKAVLAHEIFHIKQWDTLSYEVGSALMTFWLFVGYFLDETSESILTKLNPKGEKVKVIVFTAICIPIAIWWLRWTIDVHSDHHADQFAAKVSGSAEHISKALWKIFSYYKTSPFKVPFAKAFYFIVNPSEKNFFPRHFHCMPSTETRITALVNKCPPPFTGLK